MFYHCHIFDILLVYSDLQIAYLANTLVNFCDFFHIFYKIRCFLIGRIVNSNTFKLIADFYYKKAIIYISYIYWNCGLSSKS